MLRLFMFKKPKLKKHIEMGVGKIKVQGLTLVFMTNVWRENFNQGFQKFQLCKFLSDLTNYSSFKRILFKSSSTDHIQCNCGITIHEYTKLSAYVLLIFQWTLHVIIWRHDNNYQLLCRITNLHKVLHFAWGNHRCFLSKSCEWMDVSVFGACRFNINKTGSVAHVTILAWRCQW